MIRARERSQYGITNTDAACIISTAPAHATSFSTICTMRTNECDELDLHQRHQHALDCIKRYEIIFSNLQGNLYSRDERIETLEKKIVHMSFELASTKAYEDEHRSTRRSSSSDVSFRNTDDDNGKVFFCSRARDKATSTNSKANTIRRPSSQEKSCSAFSSTHFWKLYRKNRRLTKENMAILPAEKVNGAYWNKDRKEQNTSDSNRRASRRRASLVTLEGVVFPSSFDDVVRSFVTI